MGGGGAPGSAQAGLPFGGIPHELQAGVDLLLAEEPERGEPDVEFTQLPSEHESKKLTLTSLLMEYPGMCALAAVLVGLIAIFTQLGPSLVSYAINHGLTPPHYDYGVVILMAVLYLVSIVVSGGAQWGQARVTGRLASWVMNDLRIKVFRHLQRLSLDFFTEEKAGVVMSRMTSDIENLQQLLQDGLAQFAIQGLTMVVITIFLFATNAKLAAITVFCVLPPLVVMSIWFKRASERGYDKVRDGIALVLADLSESLQGVRIVTAHNRQRYNVETHRDIVGSYRDANNYTGRINGIYGPGSQVISVFGQLLILGIGGTMYLHHPQEINLGQLTAFFLYVNRFFSPIQLLVQQYNTFQQGRASVFKLQGLLETEPSVLEASDAVELPKIKGQIHFDHVSFGYDPAVPVLHDVDLTIEPGETVAFVGATGAGKSTMAKLVTRFYDPTAGRVLIDGFDLKQVTLSSLRRQLGVVPQEPFLFAGTIRDNIAFARPGAPDDEVWNAVHQVGLGELVHRLPYGLDTPGPRTGAVAVLGRAPAHCAGAGLHGRAPGPRPRRGDLEPRPEVRDHGGGGAGRAARGPHGGADRPPFVHGDAGGPHCGGRRRPPARGGLTRRARRARRALRRNVRDLDQPVARRVGHAGHPNPRSPKRNGTTPQRRHEQPSEGGDRARRAPVPTTRAPATCHHPKVIS